MDLIAVANTLAGAHGSPNFYEQINTVVDMENFHRHVAAEQWSGHGDGYVSNDNNYRVYFDPDDGRMDWMTWDLDYTFFDDYACGYTPGCSLLYTACFYDEICYEQQKLAMAELLDHMDTVDWVGQFEDLNKLSIDLALNDPRKECSNAELIPMRADVRHWLNTRTDELRAIWDL